MLHLKYRTPMNCLHYRVTSWNDTDQVTQMSAFLSNDSVYKLGDVNLLNETFVYFLLFLYILLILTQATFAKDTLHINWQIVLQVVLKIHVYEVQTWHFLTSTFLCVKIYYLTYFIYILLILILYSCNFLLGYERKLSRVLSACSHVKVVYCIFWKHQK